ncbi:MAG: transposase [Pricia sp.]|nr:transposase [Pricia sp.]
MRLYILYFIGYDIDEEVPVHSTLSRTHHLIPEELIEVVFRKLLPMYVEK